jgi:hypothetical protein
LERLEWGEVVGVGEGGGEAAGTAAATRSCPWDGRALTCLRRLRQVSGTQDGLEFEDFEGALGPVVLPADDQVAGGGVVAVRAEVAALVLELDAAAPPVAAAGVGAALGLAVGVAGAAELDQEAEVVGEGTEEADDAGLTGGGVLKAAEVEGLTKGMHLSSVVQPTAGRGARAVGGLPKHIPAARWGQGGAA